ncbi:hypothetical protein T484DRAFT_1758436, partial [Baffinella frigidus]
MENVDALASCVKGMRSADIDEAERAMLDQLTQTLNNYKAIRALGNSTDTLHVHHKEDPSAAGAVSPVEHKHAKSCSNVLAFKKVRQIDELGALRARRNLTQATTPKDCEAIRPLSDSSKSLRDHHDDDLSAARAVRHAAHSRR